MRGRTLFGDVSEVVMAPLGGVYFLFLLVKKEKKKKKEKKNTRIT